MSMQTLTTTTKPSLAYQKPLPNFSSILKIEEKNDERYLLSFFEIFKNRVAGEKIFSYLQRLGLIGQKNNQKYVFVPKTRSSILPIVCLYNTLNEKGYLKRMTQTEAGYYFCKAFGKNIHNIRMFYTDQLESCKKYDEYFFHIPQHNDFIR
jgi:hypothetical protein